MAVAEVPDPADSGTLPQPVITPLLSTNATVPVGVAVPEEAVTVAVSVTVWLVTGFAGLGESAVVVAVAAEAAVGYATPSRTTAATIAPNRVLKVTPRRQRPPGRPMPEGRWPCRSAPT